MNCPRCPRNALIERDRDGITVDVCTACRGMWLDRGELEKLTARATADMEEFEHSRKPPDRERRYRDDDDHDDDDGLRSGRRKRGWFNSLGDLFD